MHAKHADDSIASSRRGHACAGKIIQAKLYLRVLRASSTIRAESSCFLCNAAQTPRPSQAGSVVRQSFWAVAGRLCGTGGRPRVCHYSAKRSDPPPAAQAANRFAFGSHQGPNDKQWAAIEPHIPTNRPGPKPKRNGEIISGIIHVLHIGCRWQDCPREYAPHTTVHNRFSRWSKARIWQAMLAGLVAFDAAQTQCIDSTTAKAHRCAAGGKGGLKCRQSAGAEVGEPPKSTSSWMALGGLSRSA